MSATLSAESCIAFAEALLDPAVVTDATGRLLTLNAAFRGLLGFPSAVDAPSELAMLAPQRHPDALEDRLHAALQGESVLATPTELRHRDGRRIAVDLTLSPLPTDDGSTVVLWSFQPSGAADRDLEHRNLILENEARSRARRLDQTISALEAEIGERLEVERQLRFSRKRLRLLSQKTLELLESDRQTVAKELHDSIGASLAAIKFSLEGWLDVYGDRMPSPEIPFDSIIAHIVETIKETKRISANLRPTTLDDLGFLATARWFCRNLAGRYERIHITPHFDVSEADIPEPLKIVLYRVMQEALGNAAKHSGAEEIRVALGRTDGQLEMTIVDEGCGFDPEGIGGVEGSRSGFGINSMRERVEICNGRFDLHSRIGKGTRIHVLLPVETKSSEVNEAL